MSEARNTHRLLLALLLLATVLVAYWSVLGHGFTNYDDPDYVTDNPLVRGGLTVDGLRRAWTETHAANWHPLTWMSHMLDQSLYGSAPRGHHLTSLLLHAANTVLLFFLFARMTAAPMRSALVALLFGLHPLHVESVAWVAERKDVLSTFFWLLTLWAYVRHVGSDRGRFSPVVILLALGLCAKPMLVTVPLTLLLLDFWPLGRWAAAAESARSTARTLVREKLPLLPLVLASSLLTYLVQNRAGAVDPIPFGERASNAVVSYVVYLRKMLWPSDLAVLYPHPRASLPAWQVLLALALLVAVTAWAVRVRRSRPYVLFGWLWYLGTLVPVIGVVQVGQQALADRYTYVPLIGIFVALSWGLADLGCAVVEGLRGRRVARTAPTEEIVASIVGLLATPVLIALTWSQVGSWSDSVTLFERALDRTSENPTVHVNLGSAYLERGDLPRAAEHFRRALELDPRRASAHYNLGIALAEEGNLAEAEEHYRAALASSPDDPRIHNNLALALVEAGRPDEAIEHYERSLDLAPGRALVHNNLAIALATRGQSDDAIRHYEEALRIHPKYAEARDNLGLELIRSGRADQAIEHYERALEHDPHDASAHNNLAIALAARGRSDDAIRHYEEAVRLDPTHAKALNNLGLELARVGRVDEAISRFTAAVRAHPEYGAAHSNLAGALVQTGDYSGAWRHLQLARGLGQEPPAGLVKQLTNKMAGAPR